MRCFLQAALHRIPYIHLVFSLVAYALIFIQIIAEQTHEVEMIQQKYPTKQEDVQLLLLLLLFWFVCWKNRVDGGSTHNTLTFESRLAVLHSNALRVLQLILLFALDTVVNISHDKFLLIFF